MCFVLEFPINRLLSLLSVFFGHPLKSDKDLERVFFTIVTFAKLIFKNDLNYALFTFTLASMQIFCFF